MKAYSNTTDTRVALLEQSINHINETLQRIDSRLEALDKKTESNLNYLITQIANNHEQIRKDSNDNYNKLQQEINEVRKDSISQFRWTLTFITVIFGLPIIQNIITHFWSH